MATLGLVFRARAVRVKHATLLAPVMCAALCFGVRATAAPSAEELARMAQNPIGNLVSVPLQNNTNFKVGPREGTQNILNIQPVVPVEVNKDWNLITRTILPLVWQPGTTASQGTRSGVGDTQFSAFLSPSAPLPGGWIWGAGAIAQLPTNSEQLGNDNWGLGPTAVVLRIEKGSPWVYGVLVNNLWSLSSSKRGGAYSNFLMQPFLNYNLPGGTYITSSPVITADWKADDGEKWTVPLGLGVGHIFHIGKLPLNTQAGAYYNVVRPDLAPKWQLRLQAQVMFPK